MSDINTGKEHWKNDWIERVESIAEKYGVECHGVPLNVEWFINLLDMVSKKERADGINDLLAELPHKALISRKYILDAAERIKEQN